jgi:hypothetical protein
LTKVLLEPVRSAEPPTISAMAGNSASSALPEEARVARAGLVSTSLAMWASRPVKASAESLPDMAWVSSAPAGAAARRLVQALRRVAPRLPALRQAATTSSGMTKAS